uniref:Uncharacterized protein n=1 Tax=Anopheles atroparvus TaxID=41427 RepID=A0AAG5DTD7_ANOAO
MRYSSLERRVGIEFIGVIDEDILEVHVLGVEVAEVDVTVQRISERQIVDVLRARSNTARVGVIVGRELLHLRGVVRGHDEVERHFVAARETLRQEQAVGEAAMGLGVVQNELLATVVRRHDLLVQVSVSRAVADAVVEVAGVADDRVLASDEVVQVLVNLDEVLLQVLQLLEVVELGAHVHTNDALAGGLGVHIQSVGEWLVVDALLAGEHREIEEL